MRTILYVCTGNTCRSPMAEAITRHWLDGGELGDPSETFVASAGVHAAEGLPVTEETLTALERLGMTHSGASKALTGEMIRNASLVLCMTSSHREAALALVEGRPADQEKVRVLDPAGDLEDPIGRGQAAYDALAQRLLALIPARLTETLVP